MQPLVKDGVPLEATGEGAAWLQKLHKHGRRLGVELATGDSADADECEREIEQDEEIEQEVEAETEVPMMQARAESDWKCPENAMKLTSAFSLADSQGIQVREAYPCGYLS